MLRPRRLTQGVGARRERGCVQSQGHAPNDIVATPEVPPPARGVEGGGKEEAVLGGVDGAAHTLGVAPEAPPIAVVGRLDVVERKGAVH